MVRPKNECIATKGFAHLILDYEGNGSDGLEPFVSCRVLIEDLYKDRIYASNRDEAIQKFKNGEWQGSRCYGGEL